MYPSHFKKFGTKTQRDQCDWLGYNCYNNKNMNTNIIVEYYY